jgi:hypothetical protein
MTVLPRCSPESDSDQGLVADIDQTFTTLR